MRVKVPVTVEVLNCQVGSGVSLLATWHCKGELTVRSAGGRLGLNPKATMRNLVAGHTDTINQQLRCTFDARSIKKKAR